MSIETARLLQCDRCGTRYSHPEFQDAMPRPLRKSAKEQGWKVGKQKDFCPSCAESMKQEIKASIDAITNPA